MITLEKFGMFKADLYGDADRSQTDEWCRRWESMRFDRLDSIRILNDEYDHLVDPLGTMEEKSAELVDHPALPEFELTISMPVPSVMRNVIRYRKTVLPKTPKRIDGKDGFHIELTPVIDMYMSFFDKDTVDSVSTISIARFYDKDDREVGTGTTDKEFWRRRDRDLSFTIMRDRQRYYEHMRDMRLIYIGIQRAMYNKPEVFIESAGKHIMFGSGSGGDSQRNKVRVVRTIRMDSEELKRYSAPQRHMSCPCWGVAGHWRRYKSGKEIWIEPYRKGKRRDDSEAYRPKDYNFVKGGETV